MYLILFMIINLERKYCLIGYYGDDIIGDTVYNIRDIDRLMSLMYPLLSPGICFIRVHSTMHVPFVLQELSSIPVLSEVRVAQFVVLYVDYCLFLALFRLVILLICQPAISNV